MIMRPPEPTLSTRDKIIFALVALVLLMLPMLCKAGPFSDVFAESAKPLAVESSLPISISFGDAPVASVYDVTYHTADWCGPCREVQSPRVKAGHPQLRIVTTTEKPPAIQDNKYWGGTRDAMLPYFQWTDSTGKARCHEGLTTLNNLVAVIERNNPPSLTVGGKQSVTSAGVIHGRERIIAALDFIRSRVGEGVPMRFEWDRTGAQALPLLHGAAWTPLAIYGKSGEFRLSATGAINLPVADASLGYRITTDGKLRLRGETEIDASVLDWTKGDVASAGGSKAVGVDPMTILTVVSVLNGIWQALHPTADLTLGGNVSCEAVLHGDNLAIRFSQAPSVRVVAWFTFNLGVESVDVSAERVRVGFSGSRWVKERTFEVK